MDVLQGVVEIKVFAQFEEPVEVLALEVAVTASERSEPETAEVLAVEPDLPVELVLVDLTAAEEA